MSGSGRIHAESVKAKFSQAVNQSAVTTPNVKDARAYGKHRRDGRVEVLPPPRVGHRPEPYPGRILPGAPELAIRAPQQAPPPPSAPHESQPLPPGPPGYRVVYAHPRLACVAWQQAVARAGAEAVAAMADAGHLRLLALDPAQPVRGSPPLDDEHRGRLIEVGVHHLGDVGVEAVAVGTFGDGSGIDHPAGDLRLPWPLRLGALDCVHCGAVQGEPRIPAQVSAFACVRHRAENQLAV